MSVRLVLISVAMVLIALFVGVPMRFILMGANRWVPAETAVSPNNRYLAWADSRSEVYFWGGRRDYYEFSVLKREVHKNDPSFPWQYSADRVLTCDHIKGISFPLEHNELADDGPKWCDIKWLPDSSAATFELHGVSVSIATGGPFIEPSVR
jgi:hypothetical protein